MNTKEMTPQTESLVNEKPRIQVTHGDLSPGIIHVPYNWIFRDREQREATTGFVSTMLGRLALQQDDCSLWLLKTIAPATWVRVSTPLPRLLVVTEDFKAKAGDTLYLDSRKGGFEVRLPGDLTSVMGDEIKFIDMAGTVAKQRVKLVPPKGTKVRGKEKFMYAPGKRAKLVLSYSTPEFGWI